MMTGEMVVVERPGWRRRGRRRGRGGAAVASARGLRRRERTGRRACRVPLVHEAEEEMLNARRLAAVGRLFGLASGASRLYGRGGRGRKEKSGGGGRRTVIGPRYNAAAHMQMGLMTRGGFPCPS